MSSIEKNFPAFVAMALINGAFRSINREVTFVEDAIFAIRIEDAMREGKKDVDEIAWRALELEGWQPKWVDAGEISYIGLDQIDTRSPRR